MVRGGLLNEFRYWPWVIFPCLAFIFIMMPFLSVPESFWEVKLTVCNGMGLGGLSSSRFPPAFDSCVLPFFWLLSLVSWLKRVSEMVWLADVCHTIAKFCLTYLYVQHNKTLLHIPVMTTIRQLSRREILEVNNKKILFKIFWNVVWSVRTFDYCKYLECLAVSVPFRSVSIC